MELLGSKVFVGIVGPSGVKKTHQLLPRLYNPDSVLFI